MIRYHIQRDDSLYIEKVSYPTAEAANRAAYARAAFHNRGKRWNEKLRYNVLKVEDVWSTDGSTEESPS